MTSSTNLDRVAPRGRGGKRRNWRSRGLAALWRAAQWAERRLPFGARLVLGLLLMVCGVFGFLPVLGFWMLPAGIVVASLDIPPARHRVRNWLRHQLHRQVRRNRDRGRQS